MLETLGQRRCSWDLRCRRPILLVGALSPSKGGEKKAAVTATALGKHVKMVPQIFHGRFEILERIGSACFRVRGRVGFRKFSVMWVLSKVRKKASVQSSAAVVRKHITLAVTTS